jgi:aryl-alcohol dehydrogenase-like predicted oxidoreductase
MEHMQGEGGFEVTNPKDEPEGPEGSDTMLAGAASGWSRRAFLGATAAAALPLTLPLGASGVPTRPQAGAPDESDYATPPSGKMPMRELGQTGVKVSLIGLGGFHLGLPAKEETSTRIIRTALDHGVNFLDNCWDYNNGESHRRMGRALRDGYRNKAFLMTKIDGRTKKAAEEQIDQSLRSLGTDVIDLVQIHEVIRMSDPARVFAPDGAIGALVAAKQAGKLRFIGFTGHKSPEIHLEMLRVAAANGFKFDTVQMPLNVMDAHHDGFQRKVLPVLVQRNIGILAMKPLGSGLFFGSHALASRKVTPVDCLHYAMSLPTSVVITGCDTMGILYQALQAAYSFSPPDGDWTRALLAKTSAEATQGWERYKTTDVFDGTAKHPWWLETASLER